jgi:hypothetical protein
MNRDELRKIGETLWGSRWQTPMAESLGKRPRTIRRWVSGAFPVPMLEAGLLRGLYDVAMKAPKPSVTGPDEWRVDMRRRTARHKSGVVVKFTRDGDAWDGEVIAGFDILQANMTRAAKMLREGGDAFKAALDG